MDTLTYNPKLLMILLVISIILGTIGWVCFVVQYLMNLDDAECEIIDPPVIDDSDKYQGSYWSKN
jgi:hypothetical protein